MNSNYEKPISLSDWVISMIKSGRTNDPGFQAAIRYWGEKKFRKIWEEHLQHNKKNNDGYAEYKKSLVK